MANTFDNPTTGEDLLLLDEQEENTVEEVDTSEAPITEVETPITGTSLLEQDKIDTPDPIKIDGASLLAQDDIDFENDVPTSGDTFKNNEILKGYTKALKKQDGDDARAKRLATNKIVDIFDNFENQGGFTNAYGQPLRLGPAVVRNASPVGLDAKYEAQYKIWKETGDANLTESQLKEWGYDVIDQNRAKKYSDNLDDDARRTFNVQLPDYLDYIQGEAIAFNDVLGPDGAMTNRFKEASANIEAISTSFNNKRNNGEYITPEEQREAADATKALFDLNVEASNAVYDYLDAVPNINYAALENAVKRNAGYADRAINTFLLKAPAGFNLFLANTAELVWTGLSGDEPTKGSALDTYVNFSEALVDAYREDSQYYSEATSWDWVKAQDDSIIKQLYTGGDVWGLVGDTIIETGPQIAAMIILGPYSRPLMFAMAAGGKASEYRAEEVYAQNTVDFNTQQLKNTTDPNETQRLRSEIDEAEAILNRSDYIKFGVMVGHGGVEVVSESLGTLRTLSAAKKGIRGLSKTQKLNAAQMFAKKQLENAQRAIKGADSKTLDKVFGVVKKGGAVANKWFVRPAIFAVKGKVTEGIEEGVAQLGQNAFDIYLGGENKSMLEGVEESVVKGAIAGFLLGGGGAYTLRIADAVTSKYERVAINAAALRVKEISRELLTNNTLTEADRKSLVTERKEIVGRAGIIHDSAIARLGQLPVKSIKHIFTLQAQELALGNAIHETRNSKISKELKAKRIAEYRATLGTIGFIKQQHLTSRLSTKQDNIVNGLEVGTPSDIVGIKQTLEVRKSILESTQKTFEDLAGSRFKTPDTNVTAGRAEIISDIQDNARALKKIDKIIETKQKEEQVKQEKAAAARAEVDSKKIKTTKVKQTKEQKARDKENEQITGAVQDPTKNIEILKKTIGDKNLTNEFGQTINFDKEPTKEEVEVFSKTIEGKKIIKEEVEAAKKSTTISSEVIDAIEQDSTNRVNDAITTIQEFEDRLKTVDNIEAADAIVKEYQGILGDTFESINNEANTIKDSLVAEPIISKREQKVSEPKIGEVDITNEEALAERDNGTIIITEYINKLSNYKYQKLLKDKRNEHDDKLDFSEASFDEKAADAVAIAFQDALEGGMDFIKFISKVADTAPLNIDETLPDGEQLVQRLQLAKYLVVPFITDRMLEVGSAGQLAWIRQGFNEKTFLELFDSYIANVEGKKVVDTAPKRLVKVVDEVRALGFIKGASVKPPKKGNKGYFPTDKPKPIETSTIVKTINGVEVSFVKAIDPTTGLPAHSRKVHAEDIQSREEAGPLYDSLDLMNETYTEMDTEYFSMLKRNLTNPFLLYDGKNIPAKIIKAQANLKEAKESGDKKAERRFKSELKGLKNIKQSTDTSNTTAFLAIEHAIKLGVPFREIFFTDARAGRVYIANSDVNTQNASVQSTAFNIIDQKPTTLGKTGLSEILAQAAATYGVKADSILELMQWGAKNMPMLVKWGTYNDQYLDALLKEDAVIPDDLPLFMRTIQELKNIMKFDGKVEDYVPSLSIHLDETASGPQILSGWAKDEIGAEITNMTSTVKKRDPYVKYAVPTKANKDTTVFQEADASTVKAIAKSIKDGTKAKADLLGKYGIITDATPAQNKMREDFVDDLLILKEARDEATTDEAKVKAEEALAIFKNKPNYKSRLDMSARVVFGNIGEASLQRALAKNPFMTKFYSSVPIEMGNKLFEELRYENDFESLTVEDSIWLATKMFVKSGEILPKAEKMRVMLGDIANEIGSQITINTEELGKHIDAFVDKADVILKTGDRAMSKALGEAYNSVLNVPNLKKAYKADPVAAREGLKNELNLLLNSLQSKEGKTNLSSFEYLTIGTTTDLSILGKGTYYDSETKSYDFRTTIARQFLGAILIPDAINNKMSINDYAATEFAGTGLSKSYVTRQLWEEAQGVNAQGKDLEFIGHLTKGKFKKRYRNTKSGKLTFPYPTEFDTDGRPIFDKGGQNPFIAGYLKKTGRKDFASNYIIGLTDLKVPKAFNSAVANMAQYGDSTHIHGFNLDKSRDFNFKSKHDATIVRAGRGFDSQNLMRKAMKNTLGDTASTIDGTTVPMLQYLTEQVIGREAALDKIEAIGGLGNWDVSGLDYNMEFHGIAGKPRLDGDVETVLEDPLTDIPFNRAEQAKTVKAAPQASKTTTEAPIDARQEYQDALQEVKDTDPAQYWSVDNVNSETEGTVIDVKGGKGFVKTDGDIVGVFATEKGTGAGARILKAAVENGGTKLDNFDNYLTKIYKAAGFKIAGRTSFNEEYAPPGWNKESHGTPDVIAMVYDPSGDLGVEEKSFEDYDDMIAYRDSLLEEVQVIPEVQTQEPAEVSDTEITGAPNATTVASKKQANEIISEVLNDSETTTEVPVEEVTDDVAESTASKGEIAKQEGLDNAEKFSDLGRKGHNVKLFWSTAFGRLVTAGIGSLPVYIERVFKSSKTGIAFMSLSGFTGITKGKAKSKKHHKGVLETYNNKFGKTKPNNRSFNEAFNNGEREIVSFLSRTVKDETGQQAEFERRKGLIIESAGSIVTSIHERDRKMAPIYLQLLSKFEGANSIAEVRTIADKINVAAVDFYVNEWSKVKEPLFNVSMDYFNEELSDDINYTPDNYSSITRNIDLQLEMSNESSFVKSDSVSTQKDGSIMKVTRPGTLKTKIVNLSFDQNMERKLYKGLIQIHTIKDSFKLRGFLSRKGAFSSFFESPSEAAKVTQLLADYQRNTTSSYYADSSNAETKQVMKGLAWWNKLVYGKVLGGPTQFIKQYASPLTGLFLKAGKHLSTKDITGMANHDSDVYKFVANSDRPISTRGIASFSPEIEFVKNAEILQEKENALAEAIKRGASNLFKFIEDVNEWKLKTFLVSSDRAIAFTSFATYYKQHLANNNIKFRGWAEEAADRNSAAEDFAMFQIDKTQNISDGDLAGAMYSSKDTATVIMRQVFFPFTSFVSNNKVRITNNIVILTSSSATTEDKIEAARDLSAAKVELMVFAAIGVGLGAIYKSLALLLMGDDEENIKRTVGQYVVDTATYKYTDFIKDILPAPLLDEAGIKAFNVAARELDGEDAFQFAERRGDTYWDKWGIYSLGIQTIGEGYDGVKNTFGFLTKENKFTGGSKTVELRREHDKLMVRLVGFNKLSNLVGVGLPELGGVSRNLERALEKRNR